MATDPSNEFSQVDAELQLIYGDPHLSDAEIDAVLERSLNPRPSTMLYDKMDELGLNQSHYLLDVGCRDAKHTCELVKRYGCTALGIDPLADHIRRAQSVIAKAGLTDRVRAVLGRIEAIPAENDSVDSIWCRDVLSHVPDLQRGLAECHRVLVPGGSMLIYQTFGTELMEPQEAAWLYNALAVVPANQSTDYFEETAQAVGFDVIEKDEIGSEWREYWEEDGTRTTSQQLLTIARLRRDRERMIATFGEDFYVGELGNCTWGVYQMLGKLCPTLYVLRKAGG